MNVFPLVLLGLLGAEQVLDDFQYSDTRAARQAWIANEATPLVEPIDDDGRRVLRVAVPFAAEPNLGRTVIDRQVELNLASPGQFALELAAEAPEAVAHLTLYFRSGQGWYGAGGSLTKRGWQTVQFSKASFRAEGTPAGWNRIDGIRIAAWRGRSEDTFLKIGRLAALSHDVALVVPPAAADGDRGEVRSAMDAADLVSGMLEELGLGADAIDEVAVAQGALGQRRVAVLAYNPQLGAAAADALGQFVERGGKLLVCYQLRQQTGQILGFGRPTYHRQQRPGQFAEIRFSAADVPGLPEKVRQASWNITTAEPVGHHARIIGRWYDDAGKPTGQAAMLLSDRGAFLSHTVLSDDRPGKKRLLASVLGHLAPPLWPQMAQAALDRAVNVGHCRGLAELAAHVRASGNAAAQAKLGAAVEARNAAAALFDRQAYPQAVERAAESHRLLADVYLLAQPSPAREGRAVWNHSGTGAYPGDWERSAKELSAAGFNMILPNMLWGGRAHYASDVLPRSRTFEQYGDQIAQCVAAAKQHGLEVHVWKVNYNLSGAPSAFVEKLAAEGRLQVTAAGQRHPWLCPSHPENQKLELESLLEVARKYPVDGLHFDYIRYPGRETCYCDGCRRRFEAAAGSKVSDWPRECHSGPRRRQYNDWRCRQITALVEAVHREGKRLRPELKISAAVFGAYPACRESVAQDWPEWIKAGYLDFVCPMDYTQSDLAFAGLVENQMELVDGRIPVYPGIGATASRSTLSADRVVGQIYHARALGAAGFTIFNFSAGTAESILPGVGLGAGARAAAPPHRP
ncbi:MAG: family 10 glycosylhydrolase [Pirellulales bacterium]|nr:family 10 glycosylhydrolase [Pirellulales bacterium]